MFDFITPDAFSALLQVILIDLVLAGDNAIVIGLAVAGLARELRGKAILIGVVAATLLRIIFAGAATQLLQIVGLLLAGGILLLWVCWKMWRELRSMSQAASEQAYEDGHASNRPAVEPPRKTFAQATWQIAVADVSMSLENVLAVAGAAREHPYVLVFGLLLSIALMGIAANLIAGLLNRFHWIGYIGLAIILYVALDMIYRGALDVAPLAAAFGR
jgi:YjbE family integral membrane protein